MSVITDLFAPGGGKDRDVIIPPVVEPEPIQASPIGRTAARVAQPLTEEARKRRRLSASFLTRGLKDPVLGETGLTGL
jgi:hypothetical protein